MPVDDHAVHPSTQKGPDFRYGCWNHAAYSEGYWAHPWNRKGGKWVKHVMSRDCRYDLSHQDYACEGCNRRFKNV